jgi:hypothetical protein
MAALRRRVTQCAGELDMPPGIVAVDFYEQTDVLQVAKALNA